MAYVFDSRTNKWTDRDEWSRPATQPPPQPLSQQATPGAAYSQPTGGFQFRDAGGSPPTGTNQPYAPTPPRQSPTTPTGPSASGQYQSLGTNTNQPSPYPDAGPGGMTGRRWNEGPYRQPTSNTMPVPNTPAPTAPTTPAPAPAPAPGAPAAPGAAPAVAVQPQVFQGFTPKHAMEGFDFNREQNTGKSAKDAFAYLANQAPAPPINDKAKLGEWFNTYIKPGMNQLGHKINSVNGDSFNFSNWQGSFDVDFGRGAGAEGGALAWQVQEPTAKLSGGSYTPTPTAPLTTPQADTPPQQSAQQELAERELARQAEARGLTRNEAMRYRRRYQPGTQTSTGTPTPSDGGI